MMGDRGLIRYPKYFNIQSNWTTFIYGNITPSDIDFCIEYKDILFLFGELKHKKETIDLSTGQKLMIERIIDNMNKPALFFICLFDENTMDDEGRVIWDICSVEKYRVKGKWLEGKQFKAKKLCDAFIKKYEVK